MAQYLNSSLENGGVSALMSNLYKKGEKKNTAVGGNHLAKYNLFYLLVMSAVI